jgi:hypothetical protein
MRGRGILPPRAADDGFSAVRALTGPNGSGSAAPLRSEMAASTGTGSRALIVTPVGRQGLNDTFGPPLLIELLRN